MGKYMREGRGLGKMDASLGMLGGGVRTRARALAMAQEQHQEQQRGESSKSSSVVGVNLTHGCHQDVHGCKDHIYMELRSRRLEKVAKCRGQMPVLATVHTAESPDRTQLQCSVKHSAQRAVVPTRSYQSISNYAVNQSRIPDMHNRIKSHKQGGGLLRKEPENEKKASPICCYGRHLEVEPGFAESSLATGSLNRASCSLQVQASRPPSKGEATPESFIREVEAPGSSSRTRQRGSLASPMLRGSNAQISSEIQEFFDSFEQQERRRFMGRYNFDPLMEKPLQGRYDWTRIE